MGAEGTLSSHISGVTEYGSDHRVPDWMWKEMRGMAQHEQIQNKTPVADSCPTPSLVKDQGATGPEQTGFPPSRVWGGGQLSNIHAILLSLGAGNCI